MVDGPGILRAARPLLRQFERFLKERPAAVRLLVGIGRGQISRDVRVTVRGRTDGGGAQVQAVMSALSLASAAGIGYVHSPFVTIENPSDDPVTMAPRWESFFSLGYGEAQVDLRTDKLVALRQFLSDRSLWRNPGVVVYAAEFHKFCDRWPESYGSIAHSLRRKYARSDKSSLVLHDIGEGIVISAHVRRIFPSAKIAAKRNTPDEQLLHTIACASEIAGTESLPVKVNIFSDADPASLRRFSDAGYKIHAGENVFGTFHNLVRTDVLLLAKSSFTYSAAILSEGVKLYEPFWHAPLPSWLQLRPDGSFRAEGFRKALRHWLRQREQRSTR